MKNTTLSWFSGLILTLGFPLVFWAQTPCATPISGAVSSILCSDNGTAADSTDDTFTFLLAVTGGVNSWHLSTDSIPFPYGTPVSFGPFPISGGSLVLIVVDTDNVQCADTVDVAAPVPCSSVQTCTTPISASFSGVTCSDNNTPLDSLDDTFTFQLTATGATGTWSVPPDSAVYAYDSTFTFGPFPIGGGILTLIVTDNTNNQCADTVVVTPPAPCSVPVCTTPISAAFAAVACSDNGTPLDSLDDTFTFQITATGGPNTWSLPPDSLTYLYDSAYVVGPFTISSGPVTLIVTDSDNALCKDTVTVTPPAPCSVPPTMACDVKEIGCIKFELLGITIDSAKNKTYQMRVTNNCPNKLIYAAFQIPDGIVADDPQDNTVYTAPSGREYTVRNPNFSPFYSIRFKTVVDSISGGQSDEFEYTLPAQAAPTYIHAVVRVYPKIFYEVHLNTFDCPVMPVSQMQSTKLNGNQPTTDPDTIPQQLAPTDPGPFVVYPNPTTDFVFVDISQWKGQKVHLHLLNAQGADLKTAAVVALADPVKFDLPAGIGAGLYWLKAVPANGQPQVLQVMLK